MSTESAPVIGAVRTWLTVPIPAKAKVSVHGRQIEVKGPAGDVKREYPAEALGIEVAGSDVKITLKLPPNRRAAKALLNTWERHVGNLLTGATVGFEARLKSVAAHFPMKLQVKEDHLLIENFLGEKHPRSAAIVDGVTASVDGEFVVLRGADIERVGIAAATIERTTHIRDYDPRVFQDGIYIVDRAHPRTA